MRRIVTAAALGLAVLGSAGPRVVAAAPAAPPSSQDAQQTGTVQVSVSVPPVVFGGADTLPRDLRAGRPYRDRIAVHVHPTVRSGRATVTATNAAVSGCDGTEIPVGTVTAVTCTVRPAAPGPVAVTMRVTTASGATYVASYSHLAR